MPIFQLGQWACIVAADARWFSVAESNEGLRRTIVLTLTIALPQPVVQLLAAAIKPQPVMVPS